MTAVIKEWNESLTRCLNIWIGKQSDGYMNYIITKKNLANQKHLAYNSFTQFLYWQTDGGFIYPIKRQTVNLRRTSMKNLRKFIPSNNRSNLRLFLQLSIIALFAAASLLIWQTVAQMQTANENSPDERFSTKGIAGLTFGNYPNTNVTKFSFC